MYRFSSSRPFVIPDGAVLPDRRESLAPPYERRFPIKHYDAMTPAEIIKRLDLLSNEEMRIVQAHEMQHRNRRSVLEEINWRLGAV